MFKRIAVAILLVAANTSCSKQTSSPVQPVPATILTLTPADGATSVRLDAPVSFAFGVAVDPATAERGIHLVSEADMFASCPDPGMGAHGSMEAIMNDPTMLAHMDSLHSVRGSFEWDPAGKTCTFYPDSLMRGQTRYMVHMSRQMLDMMGRMGSGMGSGPMTGSGDMVTHFTTMTADDHSGHH